jgi:D-alanyl-D-alanine carboxypeptidase
MLKIAALLLTLVAAASMAQTPPATDSSARMHEQALAMVRDQQKDDAPLNALVEQAKFSGAIGIAAGRVTRSWHFNRAKVDKNDKGFDSELWRWASVTKQVMAVLVLQEVGKGTIDLDQPVSRYLPDFASANANKVTVRQLLRHQSGLPNPDDTASDPNAIAAFYVPGYKGKRDPLTGYCAGMVKGEPGGNWAYNNCDYMIAGALLEAVTGKKWSKLVQERIAKPLGLTTLGAYPAGKQTRGGLAGGKPEAKIELAAFGAAGGLYGTLNDLLAFDRALMGGKLLAPKEMAALWDGQPNLGFIALGQWVFEAPLKDCPAPVKLVERRGAIGGIQIRNFIAPDKQIAVAIFTDKSEADFEFGEIWQGSGFSHDTLNFALCPKPMEKK